VYQTVLVKLAAQFDLHPVTEYEDFQLDDLLDAPAKTSNGTPVFRRFRPNFEGSHPSLELASKLNCAFVFQKGLPREGKPAAAPHVPPTASAAPAGSGKRTRADAMLAGGAADSEAGTQRHRVEGEEAGRVDTASPRAEGRVSTLAGRNAGPASNAMIADASACVRPTSDGKASIAVGDLQLKAAVGHGDDMALGRAVGAAVGPRELLADPVTKTRNALDSIDAAKEASAREQEKMQHVAAQYSVPQYKRSSKLKRKQ
jgi:hypothetical protein